jgi:sulfatase modifying factor 1
MKKNYLFILLFSIAFFLPSRSNSQNPINPDLVTISGGSFLMGSKANYNSDTDENKQRQVTINNFELSKFEVTVWQWRAFVKATKSKMPEKPSWNWKDNFPITHITWEQAIAYCNWLSKEEKLQPVYLKKGPNYVFNIKANGYRLPTEAEWEYAAKGGKLSKATKYSGGNSPDRVAWHKANSNKAPHTIGTKRPNELGIYDMSGNVWEWCWNWYNPYYNINNKNNPKGPEMGEKRTVRGGSWDSDLNYLRPANRLSTYPNRTNEFYGFRVAKSIVQ